MEKEAQTNPPQQAAEGGCVPTSIMLVGFGMLAVGLLSILNTAFNWDLVLEVSGAAVKVPDTWDATIGVLAIGGILALVGYLTGTPKFLRFYRKNRLLVILGIVGILVGTFLGLNEFDKSIKRRNAAEAAILDSLEAANPDSFAALRKANEPAPVNYYAEREAKILVTNPRVDTMEVFLDGKPAFTIEPFEMNDGEMGPGSHRLAMVVQGDTVDTFDYTLAERTEATVDEIILFNVDSFFNIAVLNFQDYYNEKGQKLKNAKTLNYRLETLDWHPRTVLMQHESPTVTLPRKASLDFSRGKALKLVFVPDAYEGDKDKAFDYAIWKFIDEEKKGYMQDDLNFYMLSEKEKKENIRNRIKDDQKQFEKAE